MALITPAIKSFLDTQKLGYVATVSPDGLPNLSPKGTIAAWGPSCLVFADIRSPDTVKNIQSNNHVEISVIDPLLRKGYLFQGKARLVCNSDDLFRELTAHYVQKGIMSTIRAFVLVDVFGVSEVLSPLYDKGISEVEIKSKWKRHFQSL